MKAFQILLVMLFLLGAGSVAQAQIINDTLLYVTAGLQPDRSAPRADALIGLEQDGLRLQASQGYKFAAMRPGSGGMIRDSLLYLVPSDFRGRTFAGNSVRTRNQKAAIFVLTCPNQRLQLTSNGRSLVPGRGCRFQPYRNGMNTKGKYLLIVPEY